MGWLKKRFKLPKAVRKFQPGKALKKVAPSLLGFVPGIGPVASQLLALKEAAAPAAPEPAPYPREPEPDYYQPEPEPERYEYQDPAEEFRMAFTRMYGYSPWAGDPKPAGGSRRKAAASGPKAKAEKKQDVRNARAQRAPRPNNTPKGRGPSTKKRQGPDIGKMAGQAAGWVGQNAGTLWSAAQAVRNPLTAAKHWDPDMFAAAAAGLRPGASRGAGGGGHRGMNVANVKALKRGIRRLEGFKKLVKRVDKLLPMGARMASGHSHSRRPGHKAGCKCVACR